MKLFNFIFLLIISTTSFAYNKIEAVPGGIAVVPIESQTEPKAFFNNKRVLVIKKKDNYFAIVGIPLSEKIGNTPLIIAHENLEEKIPICIKSKKYKAQYISIKDKQMVTPNKKNLERILREQKIIKNTFSHWRYTPDINTNFAMPINGIVSGPFGLQRFFNKKLRSSHSGVDIAANENTKIRAPANGIVINTGNYFFNGKTIFIDHGQNLITMYCHLNNILVSPNTQVVKGQVIGYVGHTGRATGPHLHWTVSLNQAKVDPLLFVNVLNTAM